MQSTKCTSPRCGVCKLETTLVSGGAQRTSGSKLVDGNCDVTIQIHQAGSACYSTLRLDVQGATYRQISSAQITKMCDFAVLVRRNGSAKLAVLELKAGVPRPRALAQLEAGLALIHASFRAQGLSVDLRAYLVTGGQGPRFQRFVKGSRRVIPFGSRRVQVRLLKCGCSLIV